MAYLFEIINDHFEVGQRYIGKNNGAALTVAKIQEAGRYERPYGGYYDVKETLVHFRDERTGLIFVRGLETAKRLQLRLVEG